MLTRATLYDIEYSIRMFFLQSGGGMKIEFHAKLVQKKFLVEFGGFFLVHIPEKNIKKQFMFFIAHTGLENQRIIVWKDDIPLIDIQGNNYSRLETEKKALFHIINKLIIKYIAELLEDAKRLKQRLEHISVMGFSGSEISIQNFIDPDQIFYIHNTSESKNPEFQKFICKVCS